jgi:hypothetical protein
MSMSARRVRYQAGDWFAVPLRDGGYATGMVARANRKGVVLGYFFGPRRDALPQPEEVIHLQPSTAILVRQFGDLGIIKGIWPLIARSQPWHPEQWPVPIFAAVDDKRNRAWMIEYSEEDINKVVRETEINLQTAQELPRAGLAGYGAIEIILTSILSKETIQRGQ